MLTPRMQPLSALTDAALEGIDFLLFDVDETFTTHGLMHAESYATLFALREVGITAVPVTGRPSGWGNVMLSTWPINACVTENGGVISWKDANGLAQQRVIHDDDLGCGGLLPCLGDEAGIVMLAGASQAHIAARIEIAPGHVVVR